MLVASCISIRCAKKFATKDKLKRHTLSHARRNAGVSLSVGDAARREAQLRQLAAAIPTASDADEQQAGGASSLSSSRPSSMASLVTTLMGRDRAVSVNSRSKDEKLSSDIRGGVDAALAKAGWKHGCSTCGRKFLDNYHLKRHIKAIHEGPRPYKCDHLVALASSDEDLSNASTRQLERAAASSASNIPARFSPSAGKNGGNSQAATAAIPEGGSDGMMLPPCVGGIQEARGQQHRASTTVVEQGGGVQGGGVKAGQGVSRKEGGSDHHETPFPGVEVSGEEDPGRPARITRVCGLTFAKKWQLREHLHSAHGQTK